jgi:hypothetical protein
MVAVYNIKSKIKYTEFKRIYTIVDAVLPKLIETMFAFDIDFEVSSINEYQNSAIINVHYNEEDRQQICEFFTVMTKEYCKEFDIITITGVL